MTYDELRAEFDNPAFRKRLMKAKGKVCANCHGKENIEYHHIVPLSLGGTNNMSNITALCHKCHKAAHYGRHIHHYLDSGNAGRKPKAKADECASIFDAYINGEIGTRKCTEILGYSCRTRITERPEFKKYINAKGIKSVRNLIDVAATNRKNGIHDGDCVGEIEYIDGNKRDMIYHDTGANDVKYVNRA